MAVGAAFMWFIPVCRYHWGVEGEGEGLYGLSWSCSWDTLVNSALMTCSLFISSLVFLHLVFII